MTTVPAELRDLKLTPKDWVWRPGQREAAQAVLDSKKKIVLLEMECGAGKSLIPIAAATTARVRTAVLIQTIQLQEQYQRDFPVELMVGRRHYTCNVNDGPADRAPCTAGIRCSLKGSWKNGMPIGAAPQCNYFAAKAINATAPISIQNYAFWLSETANDGSSFSSMDWIICDEAHEIDQICMQAGIIELTYSILDDIKSPELPRKIEDVPAFATECDKLLATYIATHNLQIVDLEGDYQIDLSTNKSEMEKIARLRRFRRSLEQLRDLTPDDFDKWVIDDTGSQHMWQVKPIFGKYAFRRIIDAAQHKVVLMSAFLAPELLMQTLDLKEDEVEIIRSKDGFNRKKSPIVFAPTVRLKYNTPDRELRVLWAGVDAICEEFPDVPGLIHVPSIRLRDQLLNGVSPSTKKRLIWYDGAEKQRAISQFLTAWQNKYPAILLGQSISTGLDLPYVPRFQIITKLPYMPLTDPAVIARKEHDKAFYPYHTICEIVQATGRVKRAPDHDGTTIILDGSMQWFFNGNWKHFPIWFRKAYIEKNGWDQFPNAKHKINRAKAIAGMGS